MKRLGLWLLFFFGAIFCNAQNSGCTDVKKLMKKEPHPVYAKHLAASKDFKIKILKDGQSVTTYKGSGKLSPVKSLGKGYRIQKLDYSRAILVPKAKTTLKQIATDFFKSTKGSTLTFTSLTRTLEDQCRLRKVNRNAAEGLSSHNYGNSFDISYVRFNDRLQANTRLEKSLEKLLKQYEKQGKIYYIKEKKQSCFHVTVRA